MAKIWKNEKRLDQLPHVFPLKIPSLYLSEKCARETAQCGNISQWTALNYSLWVGTGNKVSRLSCHAHTDDSNKIQTSYLPVVKLKAPYAHFRQNLILATMPLSTNLSGLAQATKFPDILAIAHRCIFPKLAKYQALLEV